MTTAIDIERYTKVTLKAAAVSELIVGGQKSLHAIIPTSEFLNKEIPNKANSREFTGKKNKAVDEMITTLRKEPEMFRLKNLGIRMVASEYMRNDDELTLFFDEDEGIFNGGHTFTVLRSYGRKNAFVSVNIDLSVPKKELSDISLALNMSKKLEAISQGEKKGAFQWIKDALPNESILYKEGDQGEYPVDDVLKIANLFKIGKAKSFLDATLSQSIRSKAGIIRENNEKQTLTYTKWILPDIWHVYKELRSSAAIMKQVPANFIKKDNVLQGLIICFMAGVREMVEINKNMIPVWKEGYGPDEAIELCEELSKQVGRELKKAPFKDMKAEAVYRDANFQLRMKVMFMEAVVK